VSSGSIPKSIRLQAAAAQHIKNDLVKCPVVFDGATCRAAYQPEVFDRRDQRRQERL